ncbi:hypothetical protein IWX49DRAFT_617776 [Phyllosticta citricarpa]
MAIDRGAGWNMRGLSPCEAKISTPQFAAGEWRPRRPSCCGLWDVGGLCVCGLLLTASSLCKEKKILRHIRKSDDPGREPRRRTKWTCGAVKGELRVQQGSPSQWRVQGDVAC